MTPSAKTLRTASDLEQAGLIVPEQRAGIEQVAARYAIAITPAMVDIIDHGDPTDPIARQFVPTTAERIVGRGESPDPIGDDAHSPVEGIVHRYPDRVLLKPVHVCPVYCRFCFRREMVGPGKRRSLSAAALGAALGYIRAHPEIWEVILTGGDPLVLSAARIRALVAALGEIGHVKVIRVHTRVPAVAPQRITPALVRALRVPGKTTYVVLHANHPREITAAARAACDRIVDAGVPMLSQTVLLRGVNDDAETLATLMRAFVEARIKPYYLHHADLAPGTAHLRTSVATGQDLVRELHGRYSGLCQPTYVLDIPGGYGKSPIGPQYLSEEPPGPGGYTVTDYRGRGHRYGGAGRSET